jgi:hypothetical protein
MEYKMERQVRHVYIKSGYGLLGVAPVVEQEDAWRYGVRGDTFASQN